MATPQKVSPRTNHADKRLGCLNRRYIQHEVGETKNKWFLFQIIYFYEEVLRQSQDKLVYLPYPLFLLNMYAKWY